MDVGHLGSHLARFDGRLESERLEEIWTRPIEVDEAGPPGASVGNGQSAGGHLSQASESDSKVARPKLSWYNDEVLLRLDALVDLPASPTPVPGPASSPGPALRKGQHGPALEPSLRREAESDVETNDGQELELE